MKQSGMEFKSFSGNESESMFQTVKGDDMNITMQEANITTTGYVSDDVKEQQQLIDIQLFPNPNNGKFTIQTDHQMKNARIEIRSLDGTLVYQTRISTTFTPIELNVADGMYVVYVVAEDSVIAKKVIIGTEK
jgi:hypothetical protein